MKAVLVAPHFQPRTGGVETYVLNVGSGLVSLGWRVVVVTSGGLADTGPEDGPSGMTIYRLPTSVTVSNTPIGLKWRRQLRAIFRAERPDVINGHMPVPYLADAAERGRGEIPFMLTYHNDLYKASVVQRAVVRVLHETMIDRTLRRSDGVIATSDVYAASSPYLRKYSGKTHVVPPGVDLERFNPDVLVGPELADRYAGHRVILFVGSLNNSQRHKGLDTLIRAFVRLLSPHPDSRLVVVGDGDGLQGYKKMVADAGVGPSVEFTGHVSDDELPQYYKLATALAMPSTDRSEGFGMVFVEAGAVGTPVVGSRIGGVPYAIKDEETGLLVEPNSVDALCQALRALLEDQALSARLGAAGAARARAEFGWGPLTARTAELFRELAAPAGSGSAPESES
ncbi:MAG TPA: glycosyltransferase family 4 protein [Acidimicrobiales bacterium]|nr:glycosyltransferase family 4 protein [Acidimicrobiales bacterium]